MKKLLPILLISIVFAAAAAACSTSGEPAEQEPTATPTVEQLPEATSTTQAAVSEPTCNPDPPPPTPGAEAVEIFSPDPEQDWIKGAEDAPITIVEYGDFQCPYCAVAAENLRDLMEDYPGEIKIVYRHFPLASIHDKAILSAQAAEAAGLQGAFWEMHDLLYEKQAEWSDLSTEQFTEWAVDQAGELGLDQDQFLQDMQSEEISQQAAATWEEGQELGIPGTPYLMINNVYEAQADPALLTRFVEWIKLSEERYSECPPMTIDEDAEYLATLTTEKGEIVIRLFPEVAPLAVNSFVFLAEEDWFDENTFHRVLTDFVAQTGDPTGTGIGSPGYSFGIEVSDDLVFDREGLVAMANSGPDSNGSQFFITLGPAPHLNGGYTIFGEVVEGMEVVEQLTPRDPQSGQDLPPGDQLLDVEVELQ